MQQQNQQILKKDLGLISTIALVIGMVIGSGIFMKPAKVLLSAGDSTMCLIAWIIGGLITLAAGLTIAELGAQIPKTGGLYVYLDEVYGKFTGYLFGWVQTVLYGPAVIGALGLYFSSLIVPFIGLQQHYKLFIAIASVLIIGGLNSLGAKYGGFFQSVTTFAKMIPLVLIVGFGLVKGNASVIGVLAGGDYAVSGMGTAVLATLWAYDGWIGVGFVAGEMKNPAKQLPKAIIYGIAIIIIAYLSVNIALLHVLPADKLAAQGTQAAGTVAKILFGDLGAMLISIGIIVSIFGALNGYIFTSARVPFAMAEDGLLPGAKILSKVSPKTGSPINATFLQVALAIVYMLIGDPDRLTDIAMFIVWMFYIGAFAAVFIMRKKNNVRSRPYSVPLYPVIPLIAIAGSAYIVISMMLINPIDAIYSFGITAIGIPIYYLVVKNVVLPKTEYE